MHHRRHLHQHPEVGLDLPQTHDYVASVLRDLGYEVEVHRAASVEGELAIDDPDGIVFDAGYVAVGDCDDRLAQSQLWVREPLSAWLGQRWTLARDFRYHVAGSDHASLTVSPVT